LDLKQGSIVWSLPTSSIGGIGPIGVDLNDLRQWGCSTSQGADLNALSAVELAGNIGHTVRKSLLIFADHADLR
jgi:hypothetical protein